MDSHLWMLAFDNLLVNLDAPINFAHNYYLYQDDAGRFNPIIWDLNENFGGFSMLIGGSPLSSIGVQNLDPYLNSVNNATSVKLAYRINPSDAFKMIEMYDDGIHKDEAANDGIFGVKISTGAGGIEYYIYAENSEAAAFLPERAESEFFTLNVAGGLVVNELMADNQTTLQDSEGEFDDWVELYNNSGSDIYLNGYC